MTGGIIPESGRLLPEPVTQHAAAPPAACVRRGARVIRRLNRGRGHWP